MLFGSKFRLGGDMPVTLSAISETGFCRSFELISRVLVKSPLARGSARMIRVWALPGCRTNALSSVEKIPFPKLRAVMF